MIFSREKFDELLKEEIIWVKVCNQKIWGKLAFLDKKPLSDTRVGGRNSLIMFSNRAQERPLSKLKNDF